MGRVAKAALSRETESTEETAPRALGSSPGAVEPRNLSANDVDQFFVGVRVSPQAPPARCRFGQQHPRPLFKGRIIRGRGDHVRQALDDRNLLVTIERAGIRDDLDSNVT